MYKEAIKVAEICQEPLGTNVEYCPYDNSSKGKRAGVLIYQLLCHYSRAAPKGIISLAHLAC